MNIVCNSLFGDFYEQRGTNYTDRMRRVYLAQYCVELIPNSDGSGVRNFAVPFLQDGENIYDEDAHDWPA